MPRSHEENAQYLYDERSAHYDDSWHPHFADHMVRLIKPRPGETVLDLACGTGLVSFAASNAVGPSGKVVGVDISSGMLAQAATKKSRHHLDNVDFQQHSITSLGSLDAIAGYKFDVITCVSALVLLEDPTKALAQWAGFLKPSGRLITDVTHPKSQLAHIILERVGQMLHRPVPSYRLPFQSAEDLRITMEKAGLMVLDTKLVSQKGSKDRGEAFDAYLCHSETPVVEGVYSASDGEQKFNTLIQSKYAETLAEPNVREQARDLFLGEWTKLAGENGRIEEIDGVFVGIGEKAIL